VITVVLIAMVTGLAGLPTQNRSGPGASAFDILDPRVQSSERSIDAFGVSGLIDTVRVRKGSTFRYKVSIPNDGLFPVTIKAIDGGGRVSRQVVAVNLHPYENGWASVPSYPSRSIRTRKRSSRSDTNGYTQRGAESGRKP